jgi:hypothetical protein
MLIKANLGIDFVLSFYLRGAQRSNSAGICVTSSFVLATFVSTDVVRSQKPSQSSTCAKTFKLLNGH